MALIPAAPLFGALLTAAGPPAATDGAAEGENAFRQRCQSCHAIGSGQISVTGPNLHCIVGRKAASDNFRYSPALAKSGLVWTRESLDTFLAAPMALVPGTLMRSGIRDARLRSAVIDYLARNGN